MDATTSKSKNQHDGHGRISRPCQPVFRLEYQGLSRLDSMEQRETTGLLQRLPLLTKIRRRSVNVREEREALKKAAAQQGGGKGATD